MSSIDSPEGVDMDQEEFVDQEASMETPSPEIINTDSQEGVDMDQEEFVDQEASMETPSPEIINTDSQEGVDMDQEEFVDQEANTETPSPEILNMDSPEGVDMDQEEFVYQEASTETPSPEILNINSIDDIDDYLSDNDLGDLEEEFDKLSDSDLVDLEEKFDKLLDDEKQECNDYEIPEERSDNIKNFLELEINLEEENDIDLVTKKKIDFLWEYAKDLEDFLNENFSEDGVITKKLDEVEKKNNDFDITSSTEFSIPDKFNPNNMDNNQKLFAVLVVGAIGYFMFNRKKKNVASAPRRGAF